MTYVPCGIVYGGDEFTICSIITYTKPHAGLKTGLLGQSFYLLLFFYLVIKSEFEHAHKNLLAHAVLGVCVVHCALGL